jgi:hypothetical protein
MHELLRHTRSDEVRMGVLLVACVVLLYWALSAMSWSAGRALELAVWRRGVLQVRHEEDSSSLLADTTQVLLLSQVLALGSAARLTFLLGIAAFLAGHAALLLLLTPLDPELSPLAAYLLLAVAGALVLIVLARSLRQDRERIRELAVGLRILRSIEQLTPSRGLPGALAADSFGLEPRICINAVLFRELSGLLRLRTHWGGRALTSATHRQFSPIALKEEWDLLEIDLGAIEVAVVERSGVADVELSADVDKRYIASRSRIVRKVTSSSFSSPNALHF